VKVMTVFGTRPEIIRLSRIIPLLDSLCEHVLVHTGQNFDPELSEVFFKELRLRAPDAHLAAHRPTPAAQIAAIIDGVDAALAEHEPNRLLILGDTDSGLAALPAARRGIPVFHMEAGNRCYDARVPEEINRKIIDHASTVLMPYTTRSMHHLLREGVLRRRIFVTGNPIFEVLEHYRPDIESSSVHSALELAERRYGLATLHRAENVDDPSRLRSLMEGVTLVAGELGIPVVVSVHPRTRERLVRLGLDQPRGGLRLLKPMGLFDFIRLQRAAAVVLTDSGTVQEECCIHKVPNITIRDTSERLETVEGGSGLITGSCPRDIADAARVAISLPTDWIVPPEYLVPKVSSTVGRIVLGPAHDTV